MIVLIPTSFTDPLMVKNYENWSTFVKVIARQSWPGTFDTPCSRNSYHQNAQK